MTLSCSQTDVSQVLIVQSSARAYVESRILQAFKSANCPYQAVESIAEASG